MDEKRMKIEYLSPEDLVPYERNARTHSAEQIEQLKTSIAEFGFTNPVLIDGDGVLIAGHGRAMAAKEMGLASVPVIRLCGLTPTQVKALRLADNRLALNAGWDEELLRIELADLEGFDLDVLGFSMDELDALLPDVASSIGSDVGERDASPGQEGRAQPSSRAAMDEPEENIPDPPAEPISRRGDLWQLGRHLLFCGDSTSHGDVSAVIGGQTVDLYLTDPPYNVAYTGGATGDRKAIANDSMTPEAFMGFLTSAFREVDAHMAQGAAFYIWFASKSVLEFVSACDAVGWPVRQNLIWVKNSFTFGRQDYQWRHEPCLYGWKPGASHNWYGDRSQSTVLEFPKPQRSDFHPTTKPIALFEYLIENSTKLGDVVFDGFAGSGTTLLACERTGRAARVVELDPAYCDVIIERWERETGEKAKKV